MEMSGAEAQVVVGVRTEVVQVDIEHPSPSTVVPVAAKVRHTWPVPHTKSIFG